MLVAAFGETIDRPARTCAGLGTRPALFLRVRPPDAALTLSCTYTNAQEQRSSPARRTPLHCRPPLRIHNRTRAGPLRPPRLALSPHHPPHPLLTSHHHINTHRHNEDHIQGALPVRLLLGCR